MLVSKSEYDFIVELMELDYYEKCIKENKDIFLLYVKDIQQSIHEQLIKEGVEYESINT